jgi:hypothetical protein
MPEKLHRQLDAKADKKGLRGEKKDAYVYGTLKAVDRKRKGFEKSK